VKNRFQFLPFKCNLQRYTEVRLLKPDILCLQECEDFAGVARGLAGDGYVGLHAPRGGGKRDGSSIFYRADRFVCSAFDAVDFSPMGLRENAAAIACLQPIVVGPLYKLNPVDLTHSLKGACAGFNP
jgi:hypothetical protein